MSTSGGNAPAHTVALLHRCCSLFRVASACLTSSHNLPLPPHTLGPSPLLDLVFAVLSTTPAALAAAPQLPNIFPSIIPPFLPTLHMDAVGFFTGVVCRLGATALPFASSIARCCSSACARALAPSAVVPLITCTLASGRACVRAMGAGAAVCGVAGSYLSLAVDCLAASATGSADGGLGVWDVVQASAAFLSSLFASCLDFLGKDDVAAADAVLMQAFDVMVGNGCGGSSSSRVAVVECMRARCCSPSVSICPHIQAVITRFILGTSHTCPATRAACAESASALAAIARPGGPSLFRAQIFDVAESDPYSDSRGGRTEQKVEFGGGDGDGLDTGEGKKDNRHKRPRDVAGDSAAAPRSHRPSAPKLADSLCDDDVTHDTAVGGGAGGAAAQAGGSSSESDGGDDDDIPDIVLESADEDD